VALGVHHAVSRLWAAALAVLRDSDARTTNNVRGIVAMLIAMAAFVSGDAVMKLMSARLPTGETMFIRGWIAALIIWPLAYGTGALSNLRQHMTRILAIRSGAEMGAAVFFQNALSRLPFADVSAILQINPLVVTAAAAVFLGEKIGWRRWTATAVGMLGVLLIIRPGGAAFQWASLLLLGATGFSVLRDLITRRLPAGVPVLLMTALSSTAVGVSSLGFLPFETWLWPSLLDVLALAVPAVMMLTGQLLVVISIRSGEVSAVVPFRYSAILWTLILSLLIWGELPDRWTLLGIGIVTLAGLYTFHREQIRRHEAAVVAATRRPARQLVKATPARGPGRPGRVLTKPGTAKRRRS
jgi:drug/metabolite transporter (DMT)-like permease